MKCQYIGIFNQEELIGIALAQFIDLTHLETYGDRDKKLKTWVRNFLFSRFSSQLLFIGNNMLSGQNAFAVKEQTNILEILLTLKQAVGEMNRHSKNHLTSFKDFMLSELTHFDQATFKKDLKFTSQPNMIFEINPLWAQEEDYKKLNNLSDIHDEIKEKIYYFFSNYKNNIEGKWSIVYNFEDKNFAIKLYNECLIKL